MAELFNPLAMIMALRKMEKANKAMKSERLSAAMKGNPHGPYVMPSDRPLKPIRPGSILSDVYGDGFNNLATKRNDWNIVGHAGVNFPVIIDGKIHTMRSKPHIPAGTALRTDPKTGEMYIAKITSRDKYGDPLSFRRDDKLTSNYKKVFEAYKQAQNDYDNGVGPQWDTYRKKLADWSTRVYSTYLRQQARDEHRALAPIKKQQAAFERSQKAAEHNKRKAELERAFHGRISAEAYAGLSPWNPDYGGGFKKLTKKQMKEQGIDYGKIKSPDKKTIHLADGTTTEVIDSHLGVPLGFSQMHGYKGASETAIDSADGVSSTEYALNAFDGKHKTEKWHGDDCGHIIGLEYSSSFQLLKVTFRNGSVCVYFRVPYEIAGELLYFAENKQESTNTFDGKQRHVLGIRFWDLIRIRGTKHGSVKRFEYLDKAENSGGIIGRPSSGEYNVVPALNGREQSGYDTNALKEWVDKYEKEHGRKPTPSEYKDKIAELHKASAGDRKIAGYKTNDDGSVATVRIKTGKDNSIATTDEIDNYFDTRFNSDLANKKINRHKLQKAYSEYSDMSKDMDEELITRLLREAGADI